MFNGDESDFEAIEDHYLVLGIAQFASEDTVRRGYRLMAKRWHPDTYAQESTQDECGIAAAYAQMRFTRVQEAMEVLGNPLKRRAYDRILRSQVNAAYAGAWPGVNTPTAGHQEGARSESRGAQLDNSDYDDFYIRDWRASQSD
jgi:curved DNA-binding protein CbpA